MKRTLDELDYSWDVFISHAREDRESVARPLAERLEQAGLRTWIDLTAIDPSDNLRTKVNEGIVGSRFGAVILSPTYFEKQWTVDELNALMAMDQIGRNIVLPIVHGLAQRSLGHRYPLLANRVCLDTLSDLDDLAEATVRVVMKKGSGSPSKSFPTTRRRLIDLLAESPDPSDTRNFLRYHAGVVERAVGADTSPTTVWKPALGDVVPDVCVSNLLPTMARRDWYIVVLGPLESPLFMDGSPVPSLAKAVADIQTLRGWISGNYQAARTLLSDITMEFTGIVVAGRRAELATEQKRQLEDYNDMLFGTQVRTYDWLVESS